MSQANTIPDLVNIINCNAHGQFNCGFGYGMFQWTFNRTAGVLDVFSKKYGSRTNDITFENVYDAEYRFFKDEIKGAYSELLTDYRPTQDVAEDAKTAADKFRRVYEKNTNDIEKVKELAEAWQKELEKVGIE